MMAEQEINVVEEPDEMAGLFGEGESIEETIVDKDDKVSDDEEEAPAEIELIPKDTRFEELETKHQGEISSLRQMLREQAQDLRALQGQSARVNTALSESGNIDKAVLSPIEEESDAVSVDRVASLSLLAETMRMNNKYADLDEVCSQSNFDLAIDTLARLAVEEEGGTLTEKTAEVSEYVWGLANPYKFIYDIVKDHDPKYNASLESQVSPGKSPPSVSNIPGGSGDKSGGWSAAKIDALPEEELYLVPTAVYDQYMKNNLK